eukprot:m.224620 g.224620  ORF g.224620 m.224620 type:complete len:758 (+) comp18771_c0_seq3:221-2494(+)
MSTSATVVGSLLVPDEAEPVYSSDDNVEESPYTLANALSRTSSPRSSAAIESPYALARRDSVGDAAAGAAAGDGDGSDGGVGGAARKAPRESVLSLGTARAIEESLYALATAKEDPDYTLASPVSVSIDVPQQQPSQHHPLPPPPSSSSPPPPLLPKQSAECASGNSYGSEQGSGPLTTSAAAAEVVPSSSTPPPTDQVQPAAGAGWTSPPSSAASDTSAQRKVRIGSSRRRQGSLPVLDTEPSVRARRRSSRSSRAASEPVLTVTSRPPPPPLSSLPPPSPPPSSPPPSSPPPSSPPPSSPSTPEANHGDTSVGGLMQRHPTLEAMQEAQPVTHMREVFEGRPTVDDDIDKTCIQAVAVDTGRYTTAEGIDASAKASELEDNGCAKSSVTLDEPRVADPATAAVVPSKNADAEVLADEPTLVVRVDSYDTDVYNDLETLLLHRHESADADTGDKCSSSASPGTEDHADWEDVEADPDWPYVEFMGRNERINRAGSTKVPPLVRVFDLPSRRQFDDDAEEAPTPPPRVRPGAENYVHFARRQRSLHRGSVRKSQRCIVPVQTNVGELISAIKGTQQFWLQPELDRKQACLVLGSGVGGSFVVRHAKQRDGQQGRHFALTVRLASKSARGRHFWHGLISPSPEGFTLESAQPPAKSIIALLARCITSPSYASRAGLPCRLILPGENVSREVQAVASPSVLRRGASLKRARPARRTSGKAKPNAPNATKQAVPEDWIQDIDPQDIVVSDDDHGGNPFLA